MTFLGFLIDGQHHLVMVPCKKIAKAKAMIDEVVQPGKHKIMVQCLQQICGFFNFLCK